MQTITTKLFKNGQNQAVRIPKIFQFSGIEEVIIRKEGNSVIITPKYKSWVSLADTEIADANFMDSRLELMDTLSDIF